MVFSGFLKVSEAGVQIYLYSKDLLKNHPVFLFFKKVRPES